MRTALFLFLFFLIFLSSYLLILLSPYPPIPLSSYQPIARAASQTITVTATVDEHLTYLKKDNELIISTNLSSNFVILSFFNSQKFYISGPIEKNVPDLSNFILVAEF